MGVIDAYKNLAISSVLTAPSPAVSGTSLVLAAGEGARFPAVPFNATVWPAGGLPTPANAEVVRVTARATDTLTITRAQEGSTARAILSGDFIAAVFTEKVITDLRDSSNQNAGTLPDARHSANVPLLNLANTFTGAFQDLGAALRMRNPGGPVDRRAWAFFIATTGDFYFVSQNDANTINEVAFPFLLSRVGDLQVYGNITEKNRLTPMGHWETGDCNSYNSVGLAGPIRWSLVGKTLTVLFTMSGVLASAQASIALTIPGGYSSAMVFVGAGMMCSTPLKAWHTGVLSLSGGFSITLYDELLTGWVAGQTYINGTVVIAVP